MHRLMQSLPDIPAAARKSAIERFSETQPPILLPPNKRKWRSRCWRSSTIWCSPNCLRLEAARRCRSLGEMHAQELRQSKFRDRWTVWR